MSAENETQLIVEVWLLFKDFIHKSKKEDMAIQLLKIFEDQGIYPDEMDELYGQDDAIDKALKALYGSDDSEDEEDY